jgi:hypothetical protein
MTYNKELSKKYVQTIGCGKWLMGRISIGQQDAALSISTRFDGSSGSARTSR